MYFYILIYVNADVKSNFKPKTKANFIKNKISSPQHHMEDDSLHTFFNNDIRDNTNDFGFLFLVNFHLF